MASITITLTITKRYELATTQPSATELKSFDRNQSGDLAGLHWFYIIIIIIAYFYRAASTLHKGSQHFNLNISKRKDVFQCF